MLKGFFCIFCIFRFKSKNEIISNNLLLIICNMNKGKYVLAQLMEFVSRYDFNKCVERHNGSYRLRSLSCWDQFLALAFGQLSYQESLRSITLCLESQKEKLYHLGFSGAVPRSTLAKANEKRSWKIYRDLSRVLIAEAKRLYCDDNEFELELDGACYAIDSTVIELCLSVFGWAKLKKVRAAVKLHMKLDLRGNLPAFFNISNAKVHDLKFLDKLDIEPGAYYILDRGYTDFGRLYAINNSKAFFVIRARDEVNFRRIYSRPVNKAAGLRCDQIIKFAHWKTKSRYPEKLRRVKYYDADTKRYFVYLTNNLTINSQIVADLYRQRWQVELFFKWIKQHLKIKTFWGHSENAVKTQICVAICSYLIVAIAKKRLNIDRNLYEILQILNVCLFLKTPLPKLLSEFKLQNIETTNNKQPKLIDF